MELELKFDVARADALRLMAELGAVGEAATEQRLRSVYFDTPESFLRKNGLVLRIRDHGRGHIQAVKSRNGGGMFKRGEWETEVAGFTPDFAACAATPLVEILTPDLCAALSPAFEVDLVRLSRQLSLDDATVEVVFDDGKVAANGAVSPVCEIEMELKSGGPQALFDLAKRLSEKTVLELSFITKADRGYSLIDPSLTPKTTLHRKARAGEAFQIIAIAALARMAAAAKAMKTRTTPKAVHQMRVAARRLRGAMSLFHPMLEDDRRAAIKAELKWLAGELNDARDLDVFITDSFQPAVARHADAPGLSALGDSLTTARDGAYERAATAVDSARFRALMLDAALWVEFGDWSASADTDQAARRDRSARKTAADLLDRRFRKVAKAGRHLKAMSPEARHHLRIQAKTLRYACGFFEGLYTGAAAKAQATFEDRLVRLQDALGALNDLAVGRTLAARLAAEGPENADPGHAYAAGLVIGERRAYEAKTLKTAATAFRRLTRSEPFWD